MKTKADEIQVKPGDKAFENLTKCLLGVRKADFDKVRNADQEHKHGQTLD